jgi:hypothetical protein
MDTRHAIEFSHSSLAAGVTQDRLVEAALAFEEQVLAPRPGFLFHALLHGGGGRYAHLIVADAHERLSEVEADAPRTPAIAALLACLDRGSTRTFRHRALGPPAALPDRFGVLEHGTFAARAGSGFSEAALASAAQRVRDDYLRHEPGWLCQFVAHVGGDRYAEVVFGASPAHTRRSCAGYLEQPVCAPLLALCEPSSVELEFWLPLLMRRFTRAS